MSAAADQPKAERVPPTCFVVMPIKSSGTPEHRHFGLIYENIAEIVRSFGYDVVRADKVSTTGNINKDIITRLAQADLVVGDLTDLNPNVFYEVGLRHALRRNGTVLLFDKGRSAKLPFDLNQYRVIEYAGDLEGVHGMRTELRTTLETIRRVAGRPESDGLVDSPLHDWFPQLPSNVISHIVATTDRDMAAEVADLRRQLLAAEKQIATFDGSPLPASRRKLGVIESLRQALASGELMSNYVAKAEAATEARDIAGFLEATEQLFRARDVPDLRVYFRFGTSALLLGLGELRTAILSEASERLGTQEARAIYLRALANSPDPEDRALARQELAAVVGFDPDSGVLAQDVDADDLARNIGFFVGMLHDEGNDALGLSVLKQAMQRPDSFRFQRDYARQLDWVGDRMEAFAQYAISIRGRAAAQESFRWFGNFLHNNGLHVEAAEMFLLEAYIDLDDANGSLQFANELTFQLYDYFAISTHQDLLDLVGGKPRDLPKSIGRDTIVEACVIAMATGSMDPNQQATLRNVLERADVDGLPARRLPKPERLQWIRQMYAAIGSELTRDCDVAVRLLEVPEVSVSVATNPHLTGPRVSDQTET